MTSHAIDLGFLAAIASNETLADILAFPGTQPATLPAGLFILVSCGPLTGASPSFKSAEIRVAVEAPALDASDLSSFHVVVAALRSLLADNAGLIESFESDDVSLIGSHLGEETQGTEGDRWYWECVLRAGFVDA